MENDHLISYDRFALVVVDMKSLIYYLSDIELWHAKLHLDVTQQLRKLGIIMFST